MAVRGMDAPGCSVIVVRLLYLQCRSLASLVCKVKKDRLTFENETKAERTRLRFSFLVGECHLKSVMFAVH